MSTPSFVDRMPVGDTQEKAGLPNKQLFYTNEDTSALPDLGISPFNAMILVWRV